MLHRRKKSVYSEQIVFLLAISGAGVLVEVVYLSPLFKQLGLAPVPVQ